MLSVSLAFLKYSSLSSALLQLSLPTCNTLLHNYKFQFCRLLKMSSDLVRRVHLVVSCSVQLQCLTTCIRHLAFASFFFMSACLCVIVCMFVCYGLMPEIKVHSFTDNKST